MMIDVSRIPTTPLFTVEVSEPDRDLQGWLVIHSLGAKGACGGVRIYPDVNLDEVKELARAMTFKYAFFERSTGGAKAGIQIPLDTDKEKRAQILQAFGAHLSQLIRTGLFQPWPDMNCNAEDLKNIYLGAGITVSRVTDSSYHTALSAAAGIAATAEHLSLSPSQCRVTIDGVGSVGAVLAQEIERWGGKLVGASTRVGAVANRRGIDIVRLLEARETAGDHWVEEQGNWERISHDELFALETDIHVPCARVHSVTAESARLLQCRAVVPVANMPCTEDGEYELERRGILLLPDFVINGGGIVGTGLCDLGLDDAGVRRIFSGEFKKMCVRMIGAAERSGVTPVQAAREVAHRNFASLRRSSIATPALREKIVHALVWRGIIPKSQRLKQSAQQLIQLISERFIELTMPPVKHVSHAG